MAGKKRRLKDLRSHDDIVRADLNEDAEFRREWQRTAVARAVAIRVVQHREKSGLSQKGLAEKLGMRQPQIARLERGDTTPDLNTLEEATAARVLMAERLNEVEATDELARADAWQLAQAQEAADDALRDRLVWLA